MKAFTYKGEHYIRAVPAKSLFKSTMVHEVVNRGDIFAVSCKDQTLTIIPGTAQVEHFEITLPFREIVPPSKEVKEELEKLIAAFTAAPGPVSTGPKVPEGLFPPFFVGDTVEVLWPWWKREKRGLCKVVSTKGWKEIGFVKVQELGTEEAPFDLSYCYLRNVPDNVELQSKGR